MSDEPVTPVPPSSPGSTNPGLSDEEILKRADDIKRAQERQREEELRKAQEIQKAEERRQAEEIRKAEEIKRQEEAKKAEEQRRAEEQRKAEEAKKEAQRQEDIRRGEELKREEEAKKAAELEQARRLVAADDARKAKEEKENEKPKKKHTGLKVFLAIIIILLVLAGVTIASINVIIENGDPYFNGPYQSTYEIWLPLGQQVSIAGFPVTALSNGGQMMVNAGGQTYTMVANEPVTFATKRITITLFWGKVTLVSMLAKGELKYLSTTADGQYAYMKMRVTTDQKIPEFLFGLFLKGFEYRPTGTF